MSGHIVLRKESIASSKLQRKPWLPRASEPPPEIDSGLPRHWLDLTITFAILLSFLPVLKYSKMSLHRFFLKREKLKPSRSLSYYLFHLLWICPSKCLCYLQNGQWQFFKNAAAPWKQTLTYFRSILNIWKSITVIATIQKKWKLCRFHAREDFQRILRWLKHIVLEYLINKQKMP